MPGDSISMLEPFLDSLDGLSDALKSEYVERDGKFFLDVSEKNGWKLENIQGLRASLTSARKERDEAQQALAPFKEEDGGVFDVAKGRDALAELKKIQDAGGADEKTQKVWESREQSLTETHQRIAAEKDAKIAELTSENEELFLGREIDESLAKHKANKRYIGHEIRSRVRVVRGQDGKLRSEFLDENGEVAYSSRPDSAGKPMSIDEGVETYKAIPEWKGAFQSNGAAGSGATGSDGGSTGAGRIDPSLPLEERMAAARG